MTTRKPTTNVRKNVRKEENLALSALSSPYNMLIPLQDAAHVWLTHPVTRKTRRLSTTSPDFFTAMAELFELGVGARVQRELEQFAASDPRWSNVAAAVDAHVNTPSGAADETDTTTSNA